MSSRFCIRHPDATKACVECEADGYNAAEACRARATAATLKTDAELEATVADWFDDMPTPIGLCPECLSVLPDDDMCNDPECPDAC